MPVTFPVSIPGSPNAYACFSNWPAGMSTGTYQGTITGLTSGTIWTAGFSPLIQIIFTLSQYPSSQTYSRFYISGVTTSNFLIGETIQVSNWPIYPGGKDINGYYYLYTKLIQSTSLNTYSMLHEIRCLTATKPVSNNTIYNYTNQPTGNAIFGKSWIYSTANNTWNSLNVPVGTIMLYTGFTAPNGWVLCNGTNYSTTTYQALYNSLSIQFNATLKSSNFLSQVSSLAGLYIGMPIRGSFYTNGGTIINLGTNTTDGNFITLSSSLSGGLGTTSSFSAVPFGFTTSTTFSVPDFRSKTQIGNGTGTGLTTRNTGQTGGEENNTINSLTMASHDHSVSESSHNHSGSTQVESNTHYHKSYMRGSGQEAGGYGAVITGGFQNRIIVSGNPWDYPGYQQASTQHTHSFTTNNSTLYSTNVGTTGSGSSHNNMQPFLPLNYIIKY